jgi:hypothetical protein
MKKFLIRTGCFLLILLLPIIIGISLPTTPHASQSGFFSVYQKDSLLVHTKSPRIIFIGGSNLSYGLNSQIIKDSLHLNPINTGISQGLGIKYMLDNTLPFVKKGDIIVLIPEYFHFYNDYDYISMYTIHTALDIDKSKFKLLNFKQRLNSLQFIARISLSKFNPTEYVGFEVDPIDNRYSYNEYGDIFPHLKDTKIAYSEFPKDMYDVSMFNEEVIRKIIEFQNKVIELGGEFYISYCVIQDKSFINWEKIIKRVEEEFIKNEFTIIGTPERYILPDSLLSNSPGHPNKEGADIRTLLFLEDFKKTIMNAITE